MYAVYKLRPTRVYRTFFRGIRSNIDYEKNYYEILGVKRDATQKEIKSAYYALSKKYHPDITGSSAGSALTARFIAIKEAYDVLKDESTRRIYDAHRAQTSSEYTRQSYGSHDYRRAWGAHSRNDDPFKMRHEWPYRYDDYVKKIFEEIRRRAEAERRKDEEEARAWREHYRQQWKHRHSGRPTVKLAFEKLLGSTLKPYLPIINALLIFYLIFFFLLSLYRVTSYRQFIETNEMDRKNDNIMDDSWKRAQTTNQIEDVVNTTSRINEMISKPPSSSIV